ncbi:hypothetical protein D3C72_2360820 [compost metagenome]
MGDNPAPGCVALGNQHLGRSDKIGEGVGFMLAAALLVPAIALFHATPNMGNGVDKAAVNQREHGDRKGGGHRHAIGAIAVE